MVLKKWNHILTVTTKIIWKNFGDITPTINNKNNDDNITISMNIIMMNMMMMNMMMMSMMKIMILIFIVIMNNNIIIRKYINNKILTLEENIDIDKNL